LHDKFVERIREAIPELPKQREKRYASALQLSEYDALLITDEK
jgi:Asp-tRNA(Asn)/Glu-tRNA(Gln) amidotransferase B subunit